jgi:pyruvate/2-oxoglutarate/acetoin dehydrogenase E1 component
MGIAVGAAMTGSRPIVDMMFGDFIFLIMDQLCNQAAKTHYMSGGKLNVPLVLRTNLGATRRSAAQLIVADISRAYRRPQGRNAVICLRGKGPDEDCDPRQ